MPYILARSSHPRERKHKLSPRRLKILLVLETIGPAYVSNRNLAQLCEKAGFEDLL